MHCDALDLRGQRQSFAMISCLKYRKNSTQTKKSDLNTPRHVPGSIPTGRQQIDGGTKVE